MKCECNKSLGTSLICDDVTEHKKKDQWIFHSCEHVLNRKGYLSVLLQVNCIVSSGREQTNISKQKIGTFRTG